MIPSPRACPIATCSASMARSAREYGNCTLMAGVSEFDVANVCPCAAYQLGTSENPAYRILPALLRSSNVRITSSTGVMRSQVCSRNRST